MKSLKLRSYLISTILTFAEERQMIARIEIYIHLCQKQDLFHWSNYIYTH